MNNIYTLSYFRKRLFDSEIFNKILIKKFNDDDNRKWSVLIFEDLKILCTCLKIPKDNGEIITKFSFSDSNQNIKRTYYIQTKSMNVIIKYLKNLKETR